MDGKNMLTRKSEVTDRKRQILDEIKCENYSEKVAIWGAGKNYRQYGKLIKKYLNVTTLIDGDRSLWGAYIEGMLCTSPEEMDADIKLIIFMIDDRNVYEEYMEKFEGNGVVCIQFKVVLDILWVIYEQEKLTNIELEDANPKDRHKMKKYIGINLSENACNLRCEYCYLSAKKSSNKNCGLACTHIPRYVRACLSRKKMGGACLIGLTASGETVLADRFNDYCQELLREGHYLHIVTNGTVITKIVEIINSAGLYASHIIFKLSFHYAELVKNNLLDAFVETVNFIDASEASYTIELMPHDEIEKEIPKIIDFSMKHFGALPHLTIGRNEKNGCRLLSKRSFREFVEIWNRFESLMFQTRVSMYMMKGKKCQAGVKSFYINLNSGKIQHCLYEEEIGNIYLDDFNMLDLSAVGDKCPLNYCYNCHVYSALGILPIGDVPTYCEIRDRIKQDNSHWIKEEMREFLNVKL